MHDLLQEMGRKIVHNESPDELGKRSRLWRREDVLDTLKRDDGTNAVQGIVLDMSKIKFMRLSRQAFKKMYNLRLLKFDDPTSSVSPYHSKVQFWDGLSDISDKLRSLIWFGYPLLALPSNFNPNNLVELDLSLSNVETLWEDTMHAPRLNRLLLRDCKCLTKIPCLLESPLIEEIDIRNCSSLLDFPPLAQEGNNLCKLSMWGCESLRGCKNITKFPEISGNVTDLDLSWTAIDKVPPSIQCLTKLRMLNLSHCTRLQHIPTSIWKLKSLYQLNLENCYGLESLPEILDTMECLKTLKLSGSAIKELPENLGDLKYLRYLSADRTTRSQLPSSMKHLICLEELSFFGCRGLRFAHSSGLPLSLTMLYLSKCNLKEIPEDICRLSSLISLDLRGNHFEQLPIGMKQLCDLKYLYLNNCNKLQSLTELPSSLYHLYASDCEQLRSIPDASEFAELIRNYKYFSVFIFTNCLSLEAAVGNMLAQLRKYLNKESGVYRFCYSGSDVPGWFTYRTDGSSIQFGVPEFHEVFSGQLLGFAVCAVIAFEKYCCDGDQLTISYSFIGRECHRDYTIVVCQNKTLLDSDHVALWYHPYSLFGKPPEEFTNCSVKFSLSEESPNCRVKYCGVCPMYANQNIRETSGRRSRTSNDHREEEVEPHSKRLNLDLSLSL
ncbi:hypothetical protein Ddye_004117 [Dipteronia dyeriana]|uniref:Uncharacterized protein n=1 Tax=Dipteronia dyeriana TaxID=168575 RepID=A0AAD9XV29_9ROSI|nr:hypothetical protein Ddye_004117 [Dipteronia dyeriana]